MVGWIAASFGMGCIPNETCIAIATVLLVYSMLPNYQGPGMGSARRDPLA